MRNIGVYCLNLLKPLTKLTFFGEKSLSLELIIILTYILLVLSIGTLFSGDIKNTTDYFLGGRKASWIVIGASLYSVLISGEHFIIFPKFGASYGMAASHLIWTGCFLFFLLIYHFIPFFVNTKIFSLPEFIGKQYNHRGSRLLLATIYISIYIFMRISILLYVGGLLLNEITGLNSSTSAIIMVIVGGFYSVIGGLKAILRVDLFQSITLIFGITILISFGFHEIGGLKTLPHTFSLQLFQIRQSISFLEYSWIEILSGTLLLSFWVLCTDQMIVQRLFGTHNIDTAQKGCFAAGYLSVLSLFFFILAGIITSGLINNPEKTESIFAFFINGLFLPSYLRGIIISSILAALISSLASCFNSSSTLFTMDLYRSFRPEANERHLVLIGRLATTAMVIVSILWVPFIRFLNSNLLFNIVKMQIYLCPPIITIFLLKLFFKRINGKGIYWSLIVGTTIGLFRSGLDFFYKESLFHNSVFHRISTIPVIRFVLFSLGLCMITGLALSVQKKHQTILKNIQSYPYAKTGNEHPIKTITNRFGLNKIHFILSLGLFVLILFMNILFF